MRQFRDLYIGRSLEGNEEKILKKIKWRRVCQGIYLILVNANGTPRLECFEMRHLKRQRAWNNGILVGIATGRSEAMELIKSIVEETYQKTGDGDACNYLLAKYREGKGR